VSGVDFSKVKDMEGARAARITRAVRGVRQAGIPYIVLGLVGFSAYFIPGGPGYHRLTVLAADVAVLVAGALFRSRLASNLSGYRSLVVPVVGLGLLAACNADGLLSPVTLGVCFVSIFLWIGQWHPPGTSIRFSPVALAAYLLPYWFGAPSPAGSKASVVLVIGVSIVVAEVVARQARSVGLAQARQDEALEAVARASRTDDLTGVGNRRLGNQLLECLGSSDAVIVIDVDHFKTVNDRYGHSRGDQLLQDLGAFLACQIEQPEAVARMGGEEFLIVVKEAGQVYGTAYAQHLVETWRSMQPLASISAGVAVHLTGHSPSQTYAQADGALYRAKASGRDKAIAAS
jgi:diguanylate cyclase (GGDEF)-like protein